MNHPTSMITTPANTTPTATAPTQAATKAPTRPTTKRQMGESGQNRAAQYKIEREARQRVDDEMRPAVHYPPVRPLTALLDEHFGPIRYRIEGIAPTNGRALLVAQYKAGKTTLVGNLIRALADGEPFLGHFDVTRPAQGNRAHR